MQRIWSVDLAAHVGERVVVAGWLHRLRRLSSVSFLIVRDARGLAQIVLDDACLRHIGHLHPESVLRVQGLVVATPQAPGGVELVASAIDVLSEAVEPPPFELHRPRISAQLPTLLDHAAVSLRHPRKQAVFRVEEASVEGFGRTLRAMGFTQVFTPKLVATATESGANVFPVEYFGRRAYLAQSPQLYKQTLVGVFERVFEVGPVFRAEPHDTPRHLNEYVSLDAELPRLAARVPSIDFADAQRLIEAATGEDVVGEPDLAPDHERWLGEWALREHGSEVLFVTGFPLTKRPFYTHPDPKQPDRSNSFDLLFRGLEVVTGGQRLHRYADYLRALDERGQDAAPLAGYLEAFRHGMPPHGGFALGLERWVGRLVGAPNVREGTLFPRDVQRLTP